MEWFDIEKFHGFKTDLKASEMIRGLATETVEMLQEESPKGRRYNNSRYRKKSYSQTWMFNYYPQYDEAVVFNKENYWLTHLLEHGHFDATKAGEAGWVAEQPHIEKVFNALPDTLDKIVRQTDIDFNIY